MMYQFPIVDVTNYHQFSGLKDNPNVLSYSLGSQKSNMGFIGLNSMCQQNNVPFQRYKAEFISLPFPASKACFLHLQSQQHCICLSLLPWLHLPLILFFCPPFPLLRILVITFRVYLDNPR
jgi:hypothetical protein